MATISTSEDSLTVELTPAEKLWCLRGDVHLPRQVVERVRPTRDPFGEIRGIRAPGLGLPGLAAIGRWRHRRGQDLVIVRRGDEAVVIDLTDGGPFRRLLVGVPDADRAASDLA